MEDNIKRDELRESIKKQRQKELKKEKTRKGFIFGVVGLVVIALIVSIVWGITQINQNAKTADLGEQLTPTKVDSTGAFHVGKGGAVLDDKNATGKTRVDMWFDPMCPGCGIVDRGIGDRLHELVDKQDIDLYMTPVAFLDQSSSDKYSTRAVNATIAVAEKDPEHYLDFVNALYVEGTQPEEGTSYVSVTDDMLADTAKSVGVPESVTNTFKEGNYTEWIENNTNKQLNKRDDLFPDGFSTPSVYINVKYGKDGKATSYTKVDFQSADVLSSFNDTLKKEQANE